MENELICDKILKKFEGNKSYTWDQVHGKDFYEIIHSDYFVIENHIKFLLGDNSLQETGQPINLSLTPKGWFIMTDSAKFGYVAKRQEELKKESREKATLLWAKWATIVAILSVLIWVFDKLVSGAKTTSSVEVITESGDWFNIHNDKDEYGYADRTGNMKISFGKYSICYTDTFKTFAIVIHRTKGFVGIDKNERILFQILPFDNGPDEVSEGLFRIVQGDSIGFADKQGQIVIKPKFTSVSMFSGQLAAYCKDCKKTKDGEHWGWTGGKWGFINKTGETAIDPIYDAVLVPFTQGKAKVKFEGQEFWIDEKGKKI